MSADTLMSDAVMVPRVPTDAMIEAGERAAWDDDNSMPAISAMRKAWSAMLAASTPVGGWEDISTAPKTDEANMVAVPFIGWCPDPEADGGGDQRICWWEPKTDDGQWWSDRDLPEKPTLWTPLPSSPSVSTDKSSRPQEAVPTEQAEPAVLTGSMLEAIAHNLCSLHDFDVAFVMGQERFARAVITEYLRALPAPDFALDAQGVIAAATPQPADGCSSNEGAGGWIAHVGSPNPATGKHVRVRFRSGAEVDGAADGFEWGHWPCDGDIMAYRILPQTEKGS